jgi:hypothetical protein
LSEADVSYVITFHLLCLAAFWLLIAPDLLREV